VTATFHLLWLLCLLSGAVFAAVAAARVSWIAALSTGFLLSAVFLGPDRSPDAETAGLLAAAGAIVYLFRPRQAWLAAALGGIVAGMSTGLLTIVGVPFPLATALMAGVMAATVWRARTHAAFAPDLLREDALLLVCVLGLCAAVGPSVLDGWQAAAGLNVGAETVATRAIPAWTLSVVVMSTLLGAAHALWSRR
jgi:hypothetical protein